MEKEILSIADASQLLSLSEAEVERLLQAGELPGRRVGSHWFVSRQRLLQFIAGDDDAVSKPPPPPTPAVSKSIPPKLLMPDWRCETCHEIHGPELVECPRCGAIRNTPLMGYHLPRSRMATSIISLPKIN